MAGDIAIVKPKYLPNTNLIKICPTREFSQYSGPKYTTWIVIK